MTIVEREDVTIGDVYDICGALIQRIEGLESVVAMLTQLTLHHLGEINSPPNAREVAETIEALRHFIYKLADEIDKRDRDIVLLNLPE